MTQAYATRDPRRARRLLENLARRLEHQHPGAAASLREGLEETLTVMRLGLPEPLERVLSSLWSYPDSVDGEGRCGTKCCDGRCSRSQWVIDSRWRNGGDAGYTILR